MATDIQDLFTAESLITLQGSTAAAFLVPNVVGVLIPRTPDLARMWLAFAISMGLSLAAAATTTSADSDLWKWIVAVLNGFLIAASALGINQITQSGARSRAAPPESATAGQRFKRSWL